MFHTNCYGCFRLFQTTIKNREVPHLKSTDLNRIQVITLTCNIQDKQHYCTMLAAATGNCAATNVTYNENYLNKDWGCVILREIDFLLKIYWLIPCLHPSWKVHSWTKYYVVTWTVYLGSSMYLRRRQPSEYVRSLLCATLLLVGSVAVPC